MTVSQDLLPGVPLVESWLLKASLDQMGLTAIERNIALQLHEQGFAVLDFPDDDLDARIDRIIETLTPQCAFDHWRSEGWAANNGLRVQDAWKTSEDVRAIAVNEAVLALLGKLYGRRAFPFQTLSFPVGTQQHIHSDSIHFSSIPERFMCGVWLAMEDIHPDAGPLVYYPGSHKWPIIYNDMIGKLIGAGADFLAQTPYENVWAALVEATGVQPEYFHPKKGQALIWAANLLHGGSRQKDPARTRWSQVTHYYFDDCTYYTPAYSDPPVGNLDLRQIVDLSTGQVVPNIYINRPISEIVRREPPPPAAQHQAALVPGKIPADFDPKRYLALNADVAAARVDARKHFLKFGIRENRRYK
ncbi:phytanoyl-CoA dioxygenase family protein [Caulobacter sp.]|uniref:phytanoyl-CoA dioxygenase family protein n=1 Tax=Caulobacter sp. TaxID=78 RepID=UPI003BA9B78C